MSTTSSPRVLVPLRTRPRMGGFGPSVNDPLGAWTRDLFDELCPSR